VEEKKNGKGKGGKYFKKEKKEGKIVAGWDGQAEGSTRGPRGPEYFTLSFLCFILRQSSSQENPSSSSCHKKQIISS